MKMYVKCTAAPIGYERYEGKNGMLLTLPLPTMGYQFQPDGESNDIIVDSTAGWYFKPIPSFQEDSIIEAAREVRLHPNTDRSDYLRSLVGKRIRVTASPLPEYVGKFVFVSTYSGPDHGKVITLNARSQWERSLSGEETGWDFEEVPYVEGQQEPPMRRARERYDAQSFADELEVALGIVRSRVVEALRTSTHQPHLPEGISMRDATVRVVECLILRKMNNDFAVALDQVFDDTRVMLLHKNAAYGDSALNPVRVFSKAPIKEQLLVRLDDKASRLARGSAAGEDVAGDMLGYLVLAEMAEQRERG